MPIFPLNHVFHISQWVLRCCGYLKIQNHIYVCILISLPAIMIVEYPECSSRPPSSPPPPPPCTHTHTHLQLQMMVLKCCDISNEVRPAEVAEPWLDCLLEEYFQQSDREKMEGLPVAPFMDRDKVTKSSAQIGFIRFVLLPLFESMCRVSPSPPLLRETETISQIHGIMLEYMCHH